MQLTYAEHMKEAGRQYLAALLRECGGNVTEAARRARVNRTHLYALAEHHGVRWTKRVKTGNEAWQALGA